MHRLITSTRAFLRDDGGQDLTEYGLLASLIAIVVMAAVGDFGGELNGLWTRIISQLEAIL